MNSGFQILLLIRHIYTVIEIDNTLPRLCRGRHSTQRKACRRQHPTSTQDVLLSAGPIRYCTLEKPAGQREDGGHAPWGGARVGGAGAPKSSGKGRLRGDVLWGGATRLRARGAVPGETTPLPVRRASSACALKELLAAAVLTPGIRGWRGQMAAEVFPSARWQYCGEPDDSQSALLGKYCEAEAAFPVASSPSVPVPLPPSTSSVRPAAFPAGPGPFIGSVTPWGSARALLSSCLSVTTSQVDEHMPITSSPGLALYVFRTPSTPHPPGLTPAPFPSLHWPGIPSACLGLAEVFLVNPTPLVIPSRGGPSSGIPSRLQHLPSPSSHLDQDSFGLGRGLPCYPHS